MPTLPSMITSSSVPKQELFFEKLAWSVEDVARTLDVSVSHVYHLVSSDKIPYAKVGRIVRFSPAKISEWLQKGGSR